MLKQLRESRIKEYAGLKLVDNEEKVVDRNQKRVDKTRKRVDKADKLVDKEVCGNETGR